MTPFIVPAGLEFAAARLARDADGMLSFDTQILARVFCANGISTESLSDEDTVCEVLMQWYLTHMDAGGAPDPVMEDLYAEVAAEDALGDGLSHPPGRA